MCTALEFIPEWLLTMLPFDNERNASIFLLSRKIPRHHNIHSSAGYGPQLLHGNRQEKTQTTIKQTSQFQPLCWKGKVCFSMHCGCCSLWASVHSCSSQVVHRGSGLPHCKKKSSMVMPRLQCIHFLVLLPSSTLGFLPRELSGDR